jgi:AcrR family transcriptional regulator
LTSAAIAEAALSLMDAEGLAFLSMRTVAARLGVGTMSLYRYVDNRDALEALVVDAVVGNVDVHLPAAMPWRTKISTLITRVRRLIESHPAIVPLLLTRRQSTAGSIRWGEAMMKALAAGGFEGAARVIAFRALLSYLVGAVQVEYFGPLSGQGTAVLAALPRDAYPFIVQTAAAARRVNPDREFKEGLDAVLDGLQAARRRKRAR